MPQPTVLPACGCATCDTSCASALIAVGESVKTVQVRMGHASAMVTPDAYGHLGPDPEERTRAAVDAWLAAPPDRARTGDAPQVRGPAYLLEKA